MLVLRSTSDRGLKYFFDEYKLSDEKAGDGSVNREAKGNVTSTLEASLTEPQVAENDALRAILEDCCPPEIVKQGVTGCVSYVGQLTNTESFKGDKSTIYIHTVRE